MGDFIAAIDSLLRVKPDSEDSLGVLYHVVIERANLTDAEKKLVATKGTFSKLLTLVDNVDKLECIEPNVTLRVAMLACVIIKRLTVGYSNGQNLANRCGVFQTVDSVVRKLTVVAMDCAHLEIFTQIKAAFMAFSECLLSMIEQPRNAANIKYLAAYSDEYLHPLLNWRTQKSYDALDRLMQIIDVIAATGNFSLQASPVFQELLQDEIKHQQVPRSFDFQLLYWRFAVIANFHSCLDVIDAEAKEALTRRFLLLLETARDYISYRTAILLFAKKVTPHLVKNSRFRFPKDDDYVVDDDKAVEIIQQLSEIVRRTLSDCGTAHSPPPNIVPSPSKPIVFRQRTEGACDCFDQLMKPENSHILVNRGIHILKDLGSL